MDITDAALHTALADRLSAQAVALCLDAARNARLCGTRDQWNEMARIALAFVAERLPAREEIARVFFGAVNRTQPFEADMGGARRADLYAMADALLALLRERLGGE